MLRLVGCLTLLLFTACGGTPVPATPNPAPAAASTPAAAADPAAASAASLYRRVGGYDALAAVVDDFMERMHADPELAPFFHELQKGELDRLRQMVVDQLCEATGGPCIYVGKDMRTAHTGLGITDRDWTRAVGHLTAALNRFQVPAKEQQELLTAVSALKDQIVGQ
jgi:hemoglobin